MPFCKNKSAFWSDKTVFYFVKTAIYFAKNIDFFRAFSSEKIAFVTIWFSNRSFLHKKIAVFFQKIFVFFEKIGVFLVRKRRFFLSVSKSRFFECKKQQKNKGKNSEKIRRKIGRFCPFLTKLTICNHRTKTAGIRTSCYVLFSQLILSRKTNLHSLSCKIDNQHRHIGRWNAAYSSCLTYCARTNFA